MTRPLNLFEDSHVDAPARPVAPRSCAAQVDSVLRYRNPWAGAGEPADYTRRGCKVIEHRGCLIVHVLPMQWDTVKAGVCIAQRAGIEMAKRAAEVVDDIEFPTFQDVRARELLL